MLLEIAGVTLGYALLTILLYSVETDRSLWEVVSE
jgi:hypothetical protein